MIDYRLWYRWKNSGIYVITLEKRNSAFDILAEPQWDLQDPRNKGVLDDQWIGSGSSIEMIRRIRYRDGMSGKIYSFLTHERNLPPGLIAWLYKLRWDIEKVFDETESKLGEGKAWGRSQASKSQQFEFIAMVHNLMIMLEHQFGKHSDIFDHKSMLKQNKRKSLEQEKASEQNREMNPLYLSVNRPVQRSLQFILTPLEIYKQTPWIAALPRLRSLMQAYIP